MLLFWALVSLQMFSCTLNPSLRSWETKYLKMTDFRMNRSSCWLFWQKTCVQPTQRIAHGEDYEVRGGWRRVVFVCAVFILVASLPLAQTHEDVRISSCWWQTPCSALSPSSLSPTALKTPFMCHFTHKHTLWDAQNTHYIQRHMSAMFTTFLSAFHGHERSQWHTSETSRQMVQECVR